MNEVNQIEFGMVRMFGRVELTESNAP